MKFLICLCGFVLLMSLHSAAGERITMKISPTVAFAPANLRVRTSIESDAANRSIEIIAESADFYRSSEVQLDGDRAPRTRVVEFRSLPAGEYWVRAILRGSDSHELASTRQSANVLAVQADVP